MAEQKIEAHKVTKPIQLLAAWLVGLIIIESLFLGAASIISKPDWVPGCLVVAAILYVPVFLRLIFLLQTKYRPEMQEDTYYAKHLDKKTNLTKEVPKLTRHEKKLIEIEEIQRKILVAVTSETLEKVRTAQINNLPFIYNSPIKVAVNDLLPNYNLIKATLKKLRVTIANTYGSTNPKPDVPKQYVVSIKDTVEIQQIQQLLIGLKDTGVQGFNIFDFDPDEEDVFIGSYDYEVHAVLDDEFWDLLQDESLDEIDFETMKSIKTVKVVEDEE